MTQNCNEWPNLIASAFVFTVWWMFYFHLFSSLCWRWQEVGLKATGWTLDKKCFWKHYKSTEGGVCKCLTNERPEKTNKAEISEIIAFKLFPSYRFQDVLPTALVSPLPSQNCLSLLKCQHLLDGTPTHFSCPNFHCLPTKTFQCQRWMLLGLKIPELLQRFPIAPIRPLLNSQFTHFWILFTLFLQCKWIVPPRLTQILPLPWSFPNSSSWKWLNICTSLDMCHLSRSSVWWCKMG